MANVTIIKKYRNRETLGELELTEVVRKIKQQVYEVVCHELRKTYPLEAVQKRFGETDNASHPWKELLPDICFSAVFLNRNRQRMMKAYNGLVLLEVNNLGSSDEAEAVRRSAGMIPQTMLAFIGSSGLSVKIVCRGELFDGGLPSSDDDIRSFHINLYEKARLAYNMQLGVTIEKLEPELMRSCHISSDAGIVFNEHPQPFYVDCSDVAKAVQPIIAKSEEPDSLLPGTDNYHAMQLIYEFCLTKANDDVTGITEEEERTHLLLTSLAGYCQESGVPMAIAQRLALYNHRLGKEPDVVRKVFENAYREEHEKQHRRRKNITKPKCQQGKGFRPAQTGAAGQELHQTTGRLLSPDRAALQHVTGCFSRKEIEILLILDKPKQPVIRNHRAVFSIRESVFRKGIVEQREAAVHGGDRLLCNGVGTGIDVGQDHTTDKQCQNGGNGGTQSETRQNCRNRKKEKQQLPPPLKGVVLEPDKSFYSFGAVLNPCGVIFHFHRLSLPGYHQEFTR